MKTPPTIFGEIHRHLHLVGAGGMGVAPLGLWLAQRGFTISAEDDAWNPATRAVLEQAGVTLAPAGELPAEATLVVYSSAIAPNHPTRLAANARNLRQVRRGEMLAEAARDRRLVAVVGSHGKTTTTALLVTALVRAGFPCGWVLGGLFQDEHLGPARDQGDWLVAEVDESDGTIGAFAPELTVAVNLDWDHPDRYARPEDIEAEFAALFLRTHSIVLLSDACAMSQRLAAQPGLRTTERQVFTFGRTGDFSSQVVGEEGAMQTLALSGQFSAREARVRALGAFNAINATAALAAAQLLGATLAPDLLASFPGVRRRQSCLHASADFTLLEDYAHHPAEIRALLGSLRHRAGRLLVVFQPHRYTRTARFKAEFAAALAPADHLFLLDVYAAGETPVAGGTTADIYAECHRAGRSTPATYLPGNEAGLVSALRAALRPGDTVAFVGAGDIETLAHSFAAQVRASEERERQWTGFVADVRTRLDSSTKFLEREPLGAKTTMRIGGPARLYAEPINEADLRTLLRAAHTRSLPFFMLGRGSNLLIPDAGVDGLVISLAHPNWQSFEPLPDGRVRVGAGLRLKNLCGLALKAGLAGFEFLEGIPATVGGALRMNAGAMGGWMFNVVEEVILLDATGERRVLTKSAMHYDYRHCADLVGAVAIGAVLKPAGRGESAGLRAMLESYQKKRQESQPREPSAGCIFKNPEGTSAGRLIDEAGLKGERVGDAEVSPVHANFIVNRGHATSADVIALVRRVRARVQAARGIELQPEVMLFGADWRDVL